VTFHSGEQVIIRPVGTRRAAPTRASSAATQPPTNRVGGSGAAAPAAGGAALRLAPGAYGVVHQPQPVKTGAHMRDVIAPTREAGHNGDAVTAAAPPRAARRCWSRLRATLTAPAPAAELTRMMPMRRRARRPVNSQARCLPRCPGAGRGAAAASGRR
jgi:hypothetical protein